MNEIYLSGPLDTDSTRDLMQTLSYMGENSIYTIRMYCPGGDVEASWGIPAKMQELKAKGCRSIAKVDGMAASMAGVLLCFFDEREALDVSNIMIHRASYGVDDEGKPVIPTPEQQMMLNKINADLKSKLSAVIDNAKLKALKGVSIEDLFDEKKERINCWLTANEALQVGLITKVVAIDPVTSKYMAKAVATCYDPAIKTKVTATAAVNKLKKMTAEDLKKQDPECYEAVQKEAVNAYKAKAKAKAKAALDAIDENEEDEPEMGSKKPAKAVTEELIAKGVENALKAYGIQKVEASATAQTATFTAAQMAANGAKTPEQIKAEADAKVVTDLSEEVNKIKGGL